MRAVIQRVSKGAVVVDGATIGAVERGLLVYLGVGPADTETDVDYVANKIRYLRIFPDEAGKMNLDVAQAGGGVLLISNFSLYADIRQGRRPAFTDAADPAMAERLYEWVAARIRALGVPVEMGRFGAMMTVSSENAGPINILLDSHKAF
ncbi:MAG: D-tyrosyl-tRNA(Tyr) deacylase [Planctomycetes bacterium]|nr:D-tyrosyl-tRNA(Tyr) deacylase [Planctomycetota bacterium]